MERMILADQCASLVEPGASALQDACAQEMGACAEASGVVGGSSVQVNVASEGACVVTFGPCAADGLLDAFLGAQVEAGREEVRSQDPVEDSLGLGFGLVVQWGALGRTGAHRPRVKVEEGPSHLGGWRWELRGKKRDEIQCIWTLTHSKKDVKRGVF